MDQGLLRTAVGIDIGGTRVRVGVVGASGVIRSRTQAWTPPGGDPETLCELLAELIREVVEEARCPADAVGVAVPGILDRSTGLMQRAVNLPKLEGVNVVALLERAAGRGVHIQTDVNAATWAQWQAITPLPARFVYLSLGTGVGGGVILDGQLVRHTRGGAGHLGFLIVDTAPDALTGPDGVPGTLSAIASGPALLRAVYGEPAGTANGGESLPESVVARVARALAIGCVQLAQVYSPDVIALGGGVVDHHPELVDRARDAFARYKSSLFPQALRVARGPLPSSEAGLVGAGLLALAQ